MNKGLIAELSFNSDGCLEFLKFIHELSVDETQLCYHLNESSLMSTF